MCDAPYTSIGASTEAQLKQFSSRYRRAGVNKKIKQMKNIITKVKVIIKTNRAQG
jgi:hypothetical protein